MSEPLALDGDDDGTFLYKHLDAPPSRYPNPDQWRPGRDWVSGSELTGSGRLLPVAAVLGGSAWIPLPDNWHPFPDQWHPEPDDWVVAGIIDGTLAPAGASGAVRHEGPRTLVIGVPVGDGPGDGDHAGGVVVFFGER